MFKIETHNEVTQVTTYEDTALGIMRWGTGNSFPQTLENLIKQSPSAYPAINRTTKFYRGSGFEGEDEIINSNGMTLRHLLGIVAKDYATFKAYAIQCNYNLKGEVTSMTPIRIADLRFARFDELNTANKIGYYYNFGHNSEIHKTVNTSVTNAKIKWFDRFNPNAVQAQIKKAGTISDYLGQLLYHSDEGFSAYPVPPLQPVVNYVLSDIENSILVRKETSTGFISSYLLKTTLDSEDSTLIATEIALEEAQGARGNGKIITLSGLTEADVNSTLLEEIGSGSGGRSSVIDGASKAFELDKTVINGAYLIPPALAGIDLKSGFSGADLQEAYDVYNALTQEGRDTLEDGINKCLEKSVFNVKSIAIQPIRIGEEEQVEEVDGDEEPKKVVSKEQAEAQANLRGSVGGVQGILSIQQSVASGDTSREAALAILGEIYGFEPKVASKILGDVDEEVEVTQLNKKTEEK